MVIVIVYSKVEFGMGYMIVIGIDLNDNLRVIVVDLFVIFLGLKVYVEGYG